MKMLPILFLSLLFCAIALPVLGELTDADLNKIRLIIKEEVKAEITASEKRTREYIDLKVDGLETSLNARIDGVEKSVNARIDGVEKSVNARIDDVNDKFNRVWFVIVALIGLITAVIAIPQFIIAYRDRGRKEFQTQQQEMQTEINQLREKVEAMGHPPS